MPRPARLLLSHSFYHIMTRGNNKNVVFKNPSDYWYYLDLLRKYKNEHPFELYHYCLMPNHVHMSVQTKNAKSFATFMKKINLAYFHHFRQSYGWVGHFWQDRYKSQPIGKDNYFIQVGKYIELNPVRKGIALHPKEYPYSSFRYYAFGEKNDLIAEDIFYESLGKTVGERQEKYRKLVISDEIEQSYSKPIWGSFNQRKNEYQKHSRFYEKR